jgi:hypothetical protein
VEVRDPMEVGQRKGKAFSLVRRDKVIDIDHMNRLITLLIATTVAQRFVASGETGQKDIGHHNPLSWRYLPAIAGRLMLEAGARDDKSCVTVPHNGIGGRSISPPSPVSQAPRFWNISRNSRSISRPLLAA